MGFTKLKDAGGSGEGGVTEVEIVSPAGVFGAIETITLTPQAQGDFVYGINNQIFNETSFLGATIEVSGGMCNLSSGTNPNGSATVALRRGLKYRPGQGSMFRATALFDTPSAGNTQFLGTGTSECGYFIGYFATSFGVLHSSTGQREIRKLDITTAAGTDDITLTLNGEAISVPVTGGASLTQTAYQIGLGDYSQIGGTAGGFLTDVISSSVYFIAARSNTTSTGSYSVAGSSIVGSFTRETAGLDQVNTFIPSGSFNRDKLDGSGASEMTIDTTKGNVFEIAFQYLGFGNAAFSIEDPRTGKLFPFHIIQNANSRTTPVLKNPNLSALVTSANIAGGTTSKTIKTASLASFIEGQVIKLDPKFSLSFPFASISSATYKPLAIMKANRIFNGESSFGEFDFLRIAASNESTAKTLTVGFFLNSQVTGDVNYQYVDENYSTVSYDQLNPNSQTIVDLSNQVPFYETIVGPNNSVQENLDSLEIILGTTQTLVIAIKTSGAIVGSVSINWFEQQ